MIEVKYENGRFLVKGSYFLGLAGTYINEDFNENMLEIRDTYDYIIKELKNENSWDYQPLFSYLKPDMNEDDIARGLAEYYNQKEIEIKENIKQINDCLLFHLFENLEACGYPFWEIEETILPGSLDDYNMNNLEDEIYDVEESAYQWSDEFWDKPNNGALKKTDVETKLRKNYPMFNFEGLYQSIIPEGMSFHGRFMEFQFSDGWGGELYECAYDRFDENFTSCDWHNH